MGVGCLEIPVAVLAAVSCWFGSCLLLVLPELLVLLELLFALGEGCDLAQRVDGGAALVGLGDALDLMVDPGDRGRVGVLWGEHLGAFGLR